MKLAQAIFIGLILMGTLHGQWEPEVNISQTPDIASLTSPNNARCVAVSESIVHAVWKE